MTPNCLLFMIHIVKSHDTTATRAGKSAPHLFIQRSPFSCLDSILYELCIYQHSCHDDPTTELFNFFIRQWQFDTFQHTHNNLASSGWDFHSSPPLILWSSGNRNSRWRINRNSILGPSAAVVTCYSQIQCSVKGKFGLRTATTKNKPWCDIQWMGVKNG